MTNVVIGAASGMGAAVARQLAPRGKLFVADYNYEGAKAIADEIGGDVTAFECDISNQEQVDALMGAVDVLDAVVITAGVSGVQAPGRRILDVNVRGVNRVLRAAEPLLRPGTVGIAVASQSGYMVPNAPEMFAVLDDPFQDNWLDNLAQHYDVDNSTLAYQSSKRGVHRMARRLARAWGEKGARVLSVSPGINDTPMNRAEEEKSPVMLKMIDACPLRRRGTPDDIANVITFLTSPAAGYMTGSDVLVDGGMATVLPTTAWDGKIRELATA
jgi:NAD(P)-dependent dehydrogenase (short-subunit alcohol dehydrogenase family)